MRPEFVDNRNGNTLAKAVEGHLSWLGTTYAQSPTLSIATGYFNPSGYAILANQLDKVASVRLLLGAEPTAPPYRPKRQPGDPLGDRYDTYLIEQSLEALEEGLVEDRDLLGFRPEVDSSLRCLIEFLMSGRIEVRRYEKGFLHGKAFIFAGDEGVIAGSSNFTGAGLTTNLELNLGRYEPHTVGLVSRWFEDLWDEAEQYDLAAVYAPRFVDYNPYLIYLRVLWELYKDEMEDEKDYDSRISLTTFQNDGLLRAKMILRERNGVVIADGVGLGKTFLAGEIIRETVEEQRQRALLVAPAALRDGTWARFQSRYQLFIETVSYEQLANDVQCGGDTNHLTQGIGEYALVVIDEAQAFRNPDTKRAQALRRLLHGQPPKKLVLLTATPVNNSLWDLYYLLTYFVEHDAALADHGIRSLRERFQEAVSQDPYDLRPDTLFDILDATTVRRTRHFVQSYYPNETIPGPQGEPIRIRFPEPQVRRVEYDFGEALPEFFEDFADALAPEEGEPELSLARYWPSRYKTDELPDRRQVALVGLLRSGLLKRFESSAHAFSLTARRMAKSHDAFLAALDEGYIATPEAIDEWLNTDDDEVFESLLRASGAEPTSGYDVVALRHDVEKDRDLLLEFAERAAGVKPEDDPKLTALVEAIADIAEQAEAEAIDMQDFRNKSKVAVFSYFADTVDWIEEYILEEVKRNPRLAPYSDRIASVSGEAVRRGISREKAIFGFVPVSAEAPPDSDDDLYDMLLTTDVLAEGHNLQQCRNIINYDLPWNPMRLVQRNGRIDRIGSPHEDVYVRCFFPDSRLDELLDLEARVRQKLAQAAATIGVESEVIPEGAVNDVVFAETREEIEQLRRENPSLFMLHGEDSAAHSGEEYRQELRKGLTRYGDLITSLPWAVGSGFASGMRKGHFFCARVGERVFLRFAPSSNEGIVRDTLRCLKLINCKADTERSLPDDLRTSVYEAWQAARKDIFEEWTAATDPANLQPRVRPLFKDVAEHLREYPPLGVTQNELDKLLDAVEAPWGRRIERALREVLNSDVDDETPPEKSQRLKACIEELGLHPFVPPEPLPPIEEDDVRLVCWMAIDG